MLEELTVLANINTMDTTSIVPQHRQHPLKPKDYTFCYVA